MITHLMCLAGFMHSRGSEGGGGGGAVLIVRIAVIVWSYTVASVQRRDAERVGFLPTRQTSRAPSAKRREVFGESHQG